MKVKRGNIVYLKPKQNEGYIQHFERPFLVVSNNVGNENSGIAILVPLTSKLKSLHLPTHTVVNYHNSRALCEQIITVNQDDVVSIQHTLNKREMKDVESCLKISLGIEL